MESSDTSQEKYSTEDYDATNVLEKISRGLLYRDEINFNMIPEIILYHKQNLVKTSKIGFGSIRNNELRFFIYDLFQLIVFLKYGKEEHNQLVLKLITEDKKMDITVFDYILKRAKEFVDYYNSIPIIIDKIISMNQGNPEILNKMKSVIHSGHYLTWDNYRYFQYCSIEFEKRKIHETGIVPPGWIPSDAERMHDALVSELNAQSSNQNSKNMLFGLGIIYNNLRS